MFLHVALCVNKTLVSAEHVLQPHLQISLSDGSVNRAACGSEIMKAYGERPELQANCIFLFWTVSSLFKGALKGVLNTLNELAQSLDWVVNVICAKYNIFTCSGKLTLLLQIFFLCSHPFLQVYLPSSHMHVIDSPKFITKQKSCILDGFFSHFRRKEASTSCSGAFG